MSVMFLYVYIVSTWGTSSLLRWSLTGASTVVLCELETDGALKLNECSPKDFKLHFRIFRSFSVGVRWVRNVWYV